MSPNGFFGRLDQIARQLLADLVRTVINDPRKLLYRDAAERCRSRIARQNRGCELALERPHVTGEFGKAKVDRSVQLPQTVGEVLRTSLAQPLQLTQLFRHRI